MKLKQSQLVGPLERGLALGRSGAGGRPCGGRIATPSTQQHSQMLSDLGECSTKGAPSMLRTLVRSLSLVAILAGTAAAADDAPAASTSKVETTKATKKKAAKKAPKKVKAKKAARKSKSPKHKAKKAKKSAAKAAAAGSQ
jgi:hypothetical protein